MGKSTTDIKKDGEKEDYALRRSREGGKTSGKLWGGKIGREYLSEKLGGLAIKRRGTDCSVAVRGKGKKAQGKLILYIGDLTYRGISRKNDIKKSGNSWE